MYKNIRIPISHEYLEKKLKELVWLEVLSDR